MKITGKSLLKAGKNELPLVPVRELIVFPHVVLPVFIVRKKAIKSVEKAMEGNRRVILVFQKNKIDNPAIDDVYSTAVCAHILQLLKMPDGSLRVLLEGKERVRLTRMYENRDSLAGVYKLIQEELDLSPNTGYLMETIRKSFDVYASQSRKIPREARNAVQKAESASRLIGNICNQLNLTMDMKMSYLNEVSDGKRLEDLAVQLESEIEVLKLQKNIQGKVKKRMEKSQKEYFLNEQIKEINKELGSEEDDPSGTKELRSLIESLELTPEIKAKAEKELKRLSKLQPMSPESGVLRTYLEWITDLPWGKYSKDSNSLANASRILNEDHYDMELPKERILDFIAARQMSHKLKGPILCFVGPPGTGKTSFGRSIARALNREFIRISLGGVRDEAEIRGHRKTYVGALPGKIIQSMKKAGTMNPVFLLDEIDKMSNDFRGDPAAALLEVLDPEQNVSFMDHYLEVSCDLSKVLFITTANSLHQIPGPLLDRMEIIEVPGYTEMEKQEIARGFIIPKLLKENTLPPSALDIEDEALKLIIQSYTRESGVRNLERTIRRLIRRVIRQWIEEEQKKPERNIRHATVYHRSEPYFIHKDLLADRDINSRAFRYRITADTVSSILKKPIFDEDERLTQRIPGYIIGLAWTEVGGRILPVEVSLKKGKKELTLTGKLGDVMKESAVIALSWLKSHSEKLGIADKMDEMQEVHIHVPEGAIPKDGPSAGITIVSALYSAYINKATTDIFAMTGEITLTGYVLPIGGLKEKILAAHRNGIRQILVPSRNKRDTEELPEEIQSDLTIHFISTVEEGLKILFQD